MIDLIKESFILSLKKMLIYRTTSIMIFVFSSIFLIAEVIGVYVIFEYTDSIVGWNRNQMLFLLATSTLISDLYQFVFINQHEELGENVLEGELDYILIRPINPLVLTSIKYFDIPSLIHLIAPLSMVIYLVNDEKILLSFFNVIGYIIYILLGTIQYYCINQIFVALSFFYEKADSIIGIPEYLFDFASKPRSIYPKYIQMLMGYVIPFLLMTNIPVEIIFGNTEFDLLLWSLFITLVLVIIVKLQWKAGIKIYQSTGS